MKYGRRDFLKQAAVIAGVTALPSAVKAGAEICPQGEERLKIGVLSDIHVTNRTPGARDSNEYLLKSLRYFDREKVDAVLIAGDLFTTGLTKELEVVAATWFEVFPEDRRSDGVKIDRLFITGNHDVQGYHIRQKGKSESGVFEFERQAVWKRLFHEDYKPYFLKTVKGYPFIMRNWPAIEDRSRFLAKEAIAKYESIIRDSKVCFYCQHDQIDDTVNASWLINGTPKWWFGQDSQPTKELLSAYSNIVALTGHSHHSLTDETSLWQGKFTAVNCGCLVGWANNSPGRDNGHDEDPEPEPIKEMKEFDFLEVHQGMVMTVYDDCIRFHRREFKFDKSLGPDWIVPIGRLDGALSFAEREKNSKGPRFAEGDAVTVREIVDGSDRVGNRHAQVAVEFPVASSANGGDRAFDYSVRLEMVIGGVVRVLDEKRVFSERFMFAEEDDTKKVQCLFAKSRIPVGQDIRFVVTPYNCWMKSGQAISSCLCRW